MTHKRPRPLPGYHDRPYWEAASRGELCVQACRACGSLRYPPGPACPDCLSGDADWRHLSGQGRVVTWTTFRRAYFPDIAVPYTVVSVAADEGPMLIGNLVDFEGITPAIGLPVRAVFEDVVFDTEPGRLCQWTPIRTPISQL